MRKINSKAPAAPAFSRKIPVRGVIRFPRDGSITQATNVWADRSEMDEIIILLLSNVPVSSEERKNLRGSKNASNTVNGFPAGMVSGDTVGDATST
jgi:hypothetical protein